MHEFMFVYFESGKSLLVSLILRVFLRRPLKVHIFWEGHFRYDTSNLHALSFYSHGFKDEIVESQVNSPDDSFSSLQELNHDGNGAGVEQQETEEKKDRAATQPSSSIKKKYQLDDSFCGKKFDSFDMSNFSFMLSSLVLKYSRHVNLGELFFFCRF